MREERAWDTALTPAAVERVYGLAFRAPAANALLPVFDSAS